MKNITPNHAGASQGHLDNVAREKAYREFKRRMKKFRQPGRWVRIQIRAEDKRALAWFCRQSNLPQRMRTRMSNPFVLAYLAQIVLGLALAHPRELAAWDEAFSRYATAEGVNRCDLLRARVSEAQNEMAESEPFGAI